MDSVEDFLRIEDVDGSSEEGESELYDFEPQVLGDVKTIGDFENLGTPDSAIIINEDGSNIEGDTVAVIENMPAPVASTSKAVNQIDSQGFNNKVEAGAGIGISELDYDEEEDENDEYDDVDDDEDDEIEIENSIGVILPSLTETADMKKANQSEEQQDAARKSRDTEMREAFSELFLLADVSGSSGNVSDIGSSLKSPSPVDGSGACAYSYPDYFGIVYESPSKTTKIGEVDHHLSSKFDRDVFLAELLKVGNGAPLNLIINDNFALSPEEVDALLENLNWIFGDMDEYFKMSRVKLEQLEHNYMIQFTVGDYCLQKGTIKCRDRERLLEFKPMEVITSHALYFISLVLLGKITNAYQALMELKASISFKHTWKNEGQWDVVFEFMLKTLEVFFNYVTGRSVFATSLQQPIHSNCQWDMEQRLYLSLACFRGCEAVGKRQTFDEEAFFDAIMSQNIFNPEWGFYLIERLTANDIQPEADKHYRRSLLLTSNIVDALMKINDKKKNPFIVLAYTKYLIEHQKQYQENEIQDLIVIYRNLINLFGDIVRVRLTVAEQLQGYHSRGRDGSGLIRNCLEKAVELNSSHPKANYRLAVHYSATKTAGVMLALRYLKASIAIDGSNFDSVLEYCKILMGRHFRIMSEAFGGFSSADRPSNAVSSPVDVSGIIFAFLGGRWAKFWTSSQVAELKVLVFFVLIMAESKDAALNVLMSVYHENRVISLLKMVELMRDKYLWPSARLTQRHLILVFSEAYQVILEKEVKFLESTDKPSTSHSISDHEKKLKVMLKTMISSLSEDSV